MSYTIELSEEQMQEFQKFLSDAEDWSCRIYSEEDYRIENSRFMFDSESRANKLKQNIDNKLERDENILNIKEIFKL